MYSLISVLWVRQGKWAVVIMMTKKGVCPKYNNTFVCCKNRNQKLYRLLGSSNILHILSSSCHSIQFTTKIPDFMGGSRTKFCCFFYILKKFTLRNSVDFQSKSFSPDLLEEHLFLYGFLVYLCSGGYAFSTHIGK